MRITIEVKNKEEYMLALAMYMPSLGDLKNCSVEIIKLDSVEDKTLEMICENDGGIRITNN